MKRFILFSLILFLLCGCDKDPIPSLVPTITTGNASNVMNITATVSLSITDISNSKEIGILYGSSSAILASTDAQKGVVANLKSGNDSVSLTGLSPGTVYYYKAYASDGTIFIYGDMKTFTTGIDYATLTTNSVNSITTNQATCGGNISSSGGGSVSARGVCWSTTSNPTIANNRTTDGTGTGAFTSSITGLTANTVYYVRAYATNEKGTAYGIQVTFTTLAITIPTLTTTSVSSITTSTAISGGNITDDGGAPVTATGVCWSTTSNPTIANNKKAVGTGTSTLTSLISGLISGGKYNVQTYNIPGSRGGSVNALGVCWGTALIPNTLKSKTTDGTGSGTFTSSLTGLSANTTYYVRAYATNEKGTAYGTQVNFTTLPILLPSITTTTVSSITTTTAISGGIITNDGNTTVTARGICWSPTSNPTTANNKTIDGTGTGAFTSSISWLTSNTTYYVRAYATNSAGTAYGTQFTFTTLPILLPSLTTTTVSSITTTTAISGGIITNDGNATVTARGVCWSTASNPTIANSITSDGAGIGTFTSSIAGLTTGTTYYVKAYATNGVGTAYGSQVSFTTTGPSSGVVSDIDGNVYHYITIGTQVWMVENLKTTRYNDGTAIPNVTDGSAWSNLSTPAYCWYENSQYTYKNTYGAMYNWYTVNTGKLCPNGWHVPTDSEWTTLITYVGESGAGGKLKETGFAHWESPNTGATNESGFGALPGGQRIYDSSKWFQEQDGAFVDIGYNGQWWSSSTDARILFISYDLKGVVNGVPEDKGDGYSVRCIRDY